MTSGRVTTTRKPLAPITILDSDGNQHPIRVVLDTGFTGYLVLPDKVYASARPDRTPV